MKRKAEHGIHDSNSQNIMRRMRPSSLSWFENLFGIKETSDIRSNFVVKKGQLTSKANGKTFDVGVFECISLGQLQELYQDVDHDKFSNSSRWGHIAVDDIFEEHAKHPNALFMAASQFNCLEFVDPEITPEHGITMYKDDHTQGPACALACAANTLYRNYFVRVGEKSGLHVGQSANHQINLLEKLETFLPKKYWTITNGYLNSTSKQLDDLNGFLAKNSDELESLVQVGLVTDTQVCFSSRKTNPWTEIEPEKKVLVHQVYCSAIACGYSNISIEKWEPLAILLLKAQYEAVLLSAYLIGSTKVFLTILGGGVFQNKMEWIALAIASALVKTSHLGLDVSICHFRAVDQECKRLVDRYVKEMKKK